MIYGDISSANHNFVKTRTNHSKKKSRLNSKKITYVDDMMIHNLVKYLVQTWLRLWDIKRINFKLGSCPDDLLEICYFYISQMKLSLDKIFYKIVYHQIYMCDFFMNLDDFFCCILHEFSQKLWFSPDIFPLIYNSII